MFNAKNPTEVTYIEEFETTIYAWDCECKENFIHAKNTSTPLDQNTCHLCNSIHLEQPDSRVDEVRDYIRKQGDNLLDSLDAWDTDARDTFIQLNRLAKWGNLVIGVTI